jgi:hypothetical protein
MVTRSRVGTFKPNPKYALVTTKSTNPSTISPIPKTVHTALKDSNWRHAMALEFDALHKNKTWRLVPRPPSSHVVIGKWVFKHKLNPDGSLERYKAMWVVRGFTQHAGVDFAVKDMGELHFFLGIDVKRTPDGFFLSQERYIDDLLDRAGMSSCHPMATPVVAKGKLSADGDAIADAKSYRSLAEALQ